MRELTRSGIQCKNIFTLQHVIKQGIHSFKNTSILIDLTVEFV